MIHFITGGERSGKSSYAQTLALEKSQNPVYLATAKIWDKEFKNRVSIHQQQRDERWSLIEEELYLKEKLPESGTVVLDCITLWLTNVFQKKQNILNDSFAFAKKEIASWGNYSGDLIIVSNELGMGLHAHSKVGRDFVSLHGWSNQVIAGLADHATFMVSGLPIKIK